MVNFVYLYHGVLYSYLWKSDLYFRPAKVLFQLNFRPSGFHYIDML